MDLKTFFNADAATIVKAMVPDEMKQRLTKFFVSLIPQTIITRWDSRKQPAAAAPTVDADQLATIIRNAEAGNTDTLFALYRDLLFDSHILGEYQKRLAAMLGDQINVGPEDEEKEEDIDLAWRCQMMLKRSRDWFDAMRHLLSSCFWPVAVVEKVWRPSTDPALKFELWRLVPVPHHLLDFTTGKLRIADVDDNGNKTGTFHDADPMRYIVCRVHIMPTDDHWGGPGRAVLFWWLLKTQTVGWWARFLEKYQPVYVGKFNSGDERSRLVLETALAEAVKLGGIVINKETEFSIEQALAQGNLDGFEKFYSLCTREISKVLTGHAMSQESPASGLNSGEAGAKEQVRQDIRQLDNIRLGAVVAQQLFDDFRRYNNLPGGLPEVWWGSESYTEAKSTAEVLQATNQAGLEPTDEAIPVLSKRLGFSLRRKAAAAPPAFGAPLAALAATGTAPIGGTDPAAEANAALMAKAAPGLAAAFRGSHAPIRLAILASTSPADLEQRMRMLYPDWSEKKLQPMLADATEAFNTLVANAAAGAVRTAARPGARR
ncbi:MAG: DUF935 family protein [Verrucomicrobia bacterium]|nr:DUF935 family protein [Verrucomicrobiota bacterium]